MLFPATRLLLQLWLMLLILGTVMVGYMYRSSTIVLMGAAILAIVLLIAWSNFRLQLRATREAIHRVVA